MVEKKQPAEPGPGELAELSAQLRRDIALVGAEFTKIQEQIELAKNEKVRAKQKHNTAFDEGDAEAMTDCLKRIREANERIKNLQQSLEKFPGEVEIFYARHKTLLKLFRGQEHLQKVAWEQAEKNFKTAEAETTRCHQILTDINQLNNLTQKRESFNPVLTKSL